MNELLQEELDEIMEADGQKPEAEEGGRFTVETLDELTWVFRKLKALEAAKAEIEEMAAAEMNRIGGWRDKKTRGFDDQMAYFRGLATEFAMKQRQTDKKYKKTETPHGKVRFTKKARNLSYDDSAMLEYLSEAGKFDLIQTTSKPKKTDIKKYFHVEDGRAVDPDTGEVVDCIKVLEGEEKLDITSF